VRHSRREVLKLQRSKDENREEKSEEKTGKKEQTPGSEEKPKSEESNRNSVQDGIENFPGVFASAQSPNRQILSNCKFLRGAGGLWT
jgi:hypothetical protein